MPFYTHDNVPDSPINNFCTLNPLDPRTGTKLSEGNLKITEPSANVHGYSTSTLSINTPVYFECYCPNNAGPYNSLVVNIVKDSSNRMSLYFNNYSNGTHTKKVSGVLTTVVSSPTPYIYSGDVIGVFFEPVSGHAWYHINGTWQHSLDPTTTTTPLFTLLANQKDWFVEFGPNTNSQYANFGQDPSFGGATNLPTGAGDYDTDTAGASTGGRFAFQPPAGALALCTANLPEGQIKLSQDQTPSDNFKAVTYSGNGGTQSITGVGFQPDFVWIKARTDTRSHSLVDSVRGFNGSSAYVLQSESNSKEWQSTYINSLDTNGFTVSGSENYINNSSHTYVAWMWKAAGSPADNQAKIINEDGNQADTTCAALATAATNAGASNVITPSKVSANRQNGFSIVKYTGTGANATVPHGLSSAPEVIIVKNLDDTGGRNWIVYHHKATSTPQEDYLLLNKSDSSGTQPWYWNNTYPTSSVFSIGIANAVTYPSQAHIAYCWHSVEGYSKIGSYVGNGSADGPFVYTGFRVGWIMVKRTDSSFGGDWVIFDTSRDEHNPSIKRLYANDPTNEGISGNIMDVFSNGFKMRSVNYNITNADLIFMAFAEQPFSGPSNAR